MIEHDLERSPGPLIDSGQSGEGSLYDSLLRAGQRSQYGLASWIVN